MRFKHLRGPLLAAALAVLAAACGSDGPAPTVAAPDDAQLQQTNGVRIQLVRGGDQTGIAGGMLTLPVVVRVVNQAGQPVSGATVNFLVSAGSVATRQTKTDVRGEAQTRWTLGATVGEQTLRVSGTGGTLVVAATALPPFALKRVSGDSQFGAPGTLLTAPLVVRAAQANGTPLANVPVTWAVGGGGTLSATSVRTGADGTASVRWTVGAAGAQTVIATAPGGAAVLFRATLGTKPTPPPAPAAVASVRIEPAAVSVAVGATAALRAVAVDSVGRVVTGQRVLWTSLASWTARVDSAGVVTGVAVGSTQVRATVAGKTATAAITVVPATSPSDTRLGEVWVHHGPYPVRPGQTLYVQIWSNSDPDGLVNGTLRVRSPDGQQSATCALRRSGQYGSNPYPAPPYATFECHITIPMNAGHGTWIVDPVIILDGRGNRTTFTGAQIAARQGTKGNTFPVENHASYDRTAPTITGMTLALEPIPNSPARSLVVRMNVADAGSGATGGGVEAASTGGPLSRIMPCVMEGTGTAVCRVFIAQGEAAGQIYLVRAGVGDRAGNNREYTTAQLEALGFQARIAAP